MPPAPSSPAEPGDDHGLHALIQEQLLASPLDDETRALLLTALGEPGARQGAPRRTPRAYLRSVTVGGFRGIGRTTRLPLRPGPGLTVVTGRNGCGKSSFAEAVEIAFTGDNARWRGRSDIWRKSWRNLHDGAEPQVAVELMIEGEAEPATVLRAWHGEDVADSRAVLERPGQDPRPLDSLGWDADLTTYRPFLSYSELGQMIGGRPSEMYDAVASILGLQQLTDAARRLRELVQEHEAPAKRAAEELPGLLQRLGAVADPRAEAAVAALGGRKKDLARAAGLVTGFDGRGPDGPGGPDGAELTRLRRRADLAGPDLDAVAAAVARLRAALAAAEDAGTAAAEDARLRADLLERALVHRIGHPGESACPVCGAADRLDGDWAYEAAEQVQRLRAEAAAALAARREVGAAQDAVRQLVLPPPDWLEPEPADAWRDWLACRSLADPRELAERAPRAATVVADACRVTRAAAAKRLADLDGAWREAAGELAAWLRLAREAEEAAPRLARAKAAQKWLKAAHDELRARRMRPIGDRAQVIWGELRQQSNVTLGPVKLTGSATQRRVVLDVAVDDIDAPALGVMSQGELHSLALALFLPRTLLPENPFSFLVIDDPVQSMDPAKVDGLARVLALLAETRQVVVFTHDTRLPRSLRYLRLPATVLEVTRRERSVVQVRQADDPVRQALYDARALARTRDLPPGVMARVLPGLCRTALEAALLEPARRRLLGACLDHAEIERRVAEAHTLTELAALALHGDAARRSEALDDLERTCGAGVRELFWWCNKGAHESAPVDDVEAVLRETRRVATQVRAL
ncbi:AAA family ATPase [Streptomyces sp. B1866]|uniref:AAA family ATPase n=1 Tax=Streptomyces sp. B1866 TaxID=3075431 RepID=UPI00288DCA27|nr:AAA family ATPase [Streptomyces sp. B1866]MDT3399091.1 AAA family ATPase [Streptomyces sp. B1866]